MNDSAFNAAVAFKGFVDAITDPQNDPDAFWQPLPPMNLMRAFDLIDKELSMHLPDLPEAQRLPIAEAIVRRLRRDAPPPAAQEETSQ